MRGGRHGDWRSSKQSREKKKREKNNCKKCDVYCYRGTDMYTHFKRNYAKKLDHREEKVEKEIDVLRNLAVIYF